MLTRLSRLLRPLSLAAVSCLVALAAFAAMAASPTFAAVSLSEAPAERAAAVSGVAPVLAQPSDMALQAGETADQELHATDGDGDHITFLKTVGPDYMTVTTTDPGAGIATGNVHLAPGLAVAGVVTATVTAFDGFGTSSQSFSISVQPTPVAPVLTQPTDMTINAGDTQIQELYASDANGDPLEFNLLAGPAFVTVTTADAGGGSGLGEIVVAPGLLVSGTVTATVGVSDGSLTDQKSLTITVNHVNAAPVLSQPADMIVLAGEIKNQTLTADDADGAPLTFSMVSGPAYMTVTTVDAPAGIGNVHLAPDSVDVGTAIGEIRVSDGADSDQKTFSISVSQAALCPVGSFTKLARYVGSGLFEVQTADFNADGALDLMVEGAPGVVVLFGVGDGSFGASPLTLTAGTDPVSGAIADLNGDGVPDIAITDFSSDNISVFLGDVSGGFGPKRDVPMGGYPRSHSLAFGDLDRDGKLDMVVTRPNSGSVSVLRGVGDGTFDISTSVQVPGSPWQLVMADLNRDGSPDVIVTDLSGYLRVLLNNGAGELTLSGSYSVGTGLAGIATDDLNRDGKADVVVALRHSDFLSVFLGNGNGSLAPRRDYPTSGGPIQIAIADLNGDGLLDVASANEDLNDASILFGDGAGALGARIDVAAGFLPYGIAAGDFDNDLRTDLVVANYGGSLSIFLNRCAPSLRDNPPVVQAPNAITGGEGISIAFVVTANDPDGPAISTVTASFAALPLGHNATFVADPSNTGGTFSWTPTFDDARATEYLVTFAATNILSGTAGTRITVTNVNRAPLASAGGPYAGFAGIPVMLDGTGSSDPDGSVLAFTWVYGDGSTGGGVSPVHTYEVVGLYAIALIVSDGSLSDIATTTANVAGVLQARAFAASGSREIRLSAGKPQWCANIEPVGSSYSNAAVDLTTIVMKSAGTGAVSQIRASTEKSSISGDHDGNGVEAITACFTKSDLRLLFGNLHGSNAVTVTIEGSLFAGGIFRAQVDVNVIASGGSLAASVSPNPLNPEAILSFTTAKPGFATVHLFDLRGRLVRRVIEERALSPGYHDVRIDGRDDHGQRLASGVYFFRIHAVEGVETGQLTILK